MGNFLFLVQPKFDQITIYHQDDLERPLEQYKKLEQSKKKTPNLSKSKESQKIIQKKSKEEGKLDRISANAELVEKMNKIKVSIKMFSQLSDTDHNLFFRLFAYHYKLYF